MKKNRKRSPGRARVRNGQPPSAVKPWKGFLAGVLIAASMVVMGTSWEEVYRTLQVRSILFVGTGTPSVTQTQGSIYNSGTLETDGAARFDGTVTANTSITAAGAVTLTGSNTIKNVPYVAGLNSVTVTGSFGDANYDVLLVPTDNVSPAGVANKTATSFDVLYAATSNVTAPAIVIHHNL